MANSVFSMSMDLDISSFENKLNQVDSALNTTQTKLEKARDALKDDAVNDSNGYVANTDAFDLFSSVRQSVIELKNEFTSQNKGASNFFGDLVAPLKEAYSLLGKINSMSNTASGLNGVVYPETMNKLNLYQARLRMITDEMKTFQTTMASLDQSSQTFLANNGAGFARQIKGAVRGIGDQTGVKGSLEATVASILTQDVIKKSLTEYGVQEKAQQEALVRAAVIAASDRADRRSHGMYLNKRLITNYDSPAFIQERLPEQFRTSFLERAQAPKGERRRYNTPAEIAQTYENIRKSVNKGNNLAYKFAEQAKLFKYGSNGKLNWLKDENVTDDMLNYFQSLAVMEARESLESYKMWQKSIENRDDRASLMTKETKNFGLAKSIMDLDKRTHIFPYSKTKRSIRDLADSAYTGYESKIPKLKIPEMIQIPRVTIGKDGTFANIETEDVENAVNYAWNRNGIRETERDQQITMGRNPVLDRLMNLKATGSRQYRAQVKGEPERIFTNRGLGYGRDENGQQIEWLPIVMQMSMLDLFKKDKSGNVQFDIEGKNPVFNEDKTIDYNGNTYTQEQFANMVAEQRIPINLKYKGKLKGQDVSKTMPYVAMAMDGTGGQARFLMVQQRDAEEMARQDRERGIPLMGNFYNEMALVNGRQRIIGKDGKVLEGDDQFGAMRRYYDASRKNFSHSIPIEEVGGKTPKASLVNFEAMYDYWNTPKSERFDGGVFIMPNVFDKDFQGRMGPGKFMAQRGDYKKFLEDAGATYSDIGGKNYAYMPAIGTSAKEYGQYLKYLHDFTQLVDVKDKDGNVVRQQRQLRPDFDTLNVKERIPGIKDWKSFSEWRDAKFANVLDPEKEMLMSADTVLKNYFKTEMLTYENYKKIFGKNATPNSILNNQTKWDNGDLVKLSAEEQTRYLEQIADPKYGAGLRIMKDMLNYQGSKDFVSSAMMSTMVVTPEMMAASKKNYKDALADLSNPYKVRQKLFSGDDLLSQIVKQNPEAIFSNGDVRREIESAKNQLQEHMAKGELYLPNFYKNFLVTASMPSVFGGFAKDVTGTRGFKLTGSAGDLVLPEKTMFAPGFKHAQAMATRSPFAEGASLLVDNAAYGNFATRYEAARRKYQLSKDSSVFNVGDFYKLNTGDFDGDFAFLLDTDVDKYGEYARETERRNDLVRGEMIELSKEIDRKKQRDRAYSNSPDYAHSVAAGQIIGRGMGQAWNAIMGARTNPDMPEQNLAKGQAQGNLIYDAWSAWVKKPDVVPEFGKESDYSNLSKHGRTLERVNDALLTAFATKDYSQLPDPSKVVTPRYHDLIGLHMMSTMKESRDVDPGSLRDLETAYNRWAQEAPIENEPQALKALRERYVSFLRDKGTGEFQITELIPFTEEFDKLYKAADSEVKALKLDFESKKAGMQPVEIAKREKELEELSTTVWRYGQRISEEKMHGVTDAAIAHGMFTGKEDLVEGFRKKDDVEYLARVRELQEIQNNQLKLGLQPTNPIMLSDEAKARMSYMAKRRLIANQFTPFNWSSASNYLPDLHVPTTVTEYNAMEPDFTTGEIVGVPNKPESFSNIVKADKDKVRHDYYLKQNARNILFNETVATPTSVVGSLAHGFMEKYQKTYLDYLERHAGEHDVAAKVALKAAYKNLNDSVLQPWSEQQEIYDAAKIQFKLKEGANGTSLEDYTIEKKDGANLDQFEAMDLGSAQTHYDQLTKRGINGITAPEALATNFLNPLLKSGRVVMIEGVSYENKNGTLRPIAKDEDANGIRVGLSRDKTYGIGRLYMEDDGTPKPKDIEYRFTPDLMYANPDTENVNGKTTYTIADWKSSDYGIGKGRLQMAFYAHNLEELAKLYHSGARPDLERFAKYWDWDENDPNKGRSLITRTNGLNLNTGHYYTADYNQQKGEFIARKISEAYSNMIQSMGRGYIDELPDEDMKDAGKLRMGKNRNVPVNAPRSVFDTSSAEAIGRYNFDPDKMTDDILSQLYQNAPEKMAEIERYASMNGEMIENVDRALKSGSSQNKEYLALKLHDVNKAVADVGSFVAKKSETRYGFKDEYTRQLNQIDKILNLQDEEAINQYLKQENLAPDVALMANDYMDNKISLDNFKQKIHALGIQNLGRAITSTDATMGSVFGGKGSLSDKYFSSQARIEALESQARLYETLQPGIWDEKNKFKTDYEHYYKKDLADKIKRNEQAAKTGKPIEAYTKEELEGDIEHGIYGINHKTDVENLIKEAKKAEQGQEDARIKIEELKQKQSIYLNQALDESILSSKYTTQSALTGDMYAKTEDDLQVEETVNLIKAFDSKKQAIQDALDAVDKMLDAKISTDKNPKGENEIQGALRGRLANFKKELEKDKKAIDDKRDEEIKNVAKRQAEQYKERLVQADIDANKRRTEATGGNRSFAELSQKDFNLNKSIKEKENELKSIDQQLSKTPNDKELLFKKSVLSENIYSDKLELQRLRSEAPRNASLYFQQGIERINEEIFGDKSGLEKLTDNLRIKKQQDNITELLSSARSARRAGVIDTAEFDAIKTRLEEARTKITDGSWLKEQKRKDEREKTDITERNVLKSNQNALDVKASMTGQQMTAQEYAHSQAERARYNNRSRLREIEQRLEDTSISLEERKALEREQQVINRYNTDAAYAAYENRIVRQQEFSNSQARFRNLQEGYGFIDSTAMWSPDIHERYRRAEKTQRNYIEQQRHKLDEDERAGKYRGHERELALRRSEINNFDWDRFQTNWYMGENVRVAQAQARGVNMLNDTYSILDMAGAHSTPSVNNQLARRMASIVASNAAKEAELIQMLANPDVSAGREAEFSDAIDALRTIDYNAIERRERTRIENQRADMADSAMQLANQAIRSTDEYETYVDPKIAAQRRVEDKRRENAKLIRDIQEKLDANAYQTPDEVLAATEALYAAQNYDYDALERKTEAQKRTERNQIEARHASEELANRAKFQGRYATRQETQTRRNLDLIAEREAYLANSIANGTMTDAEAEAYRRAYSNPYLYGVAAFEGNAQFNTQRFQNIAQGISANAQLMGHYLRPGEAYDQKLAQLNITRTQEAERVRQEASMNAAANGMSPTDALREGARAYQAYMNTYNDAVLEATARRDADYEHAQRESTFEQQQRTTTADIEGRGLSQRERIDNRVAQMRQKRDQIVRERYMRGDMHGAWMYQLTHGESELERIATMDDEIATEQLARRRQAQLEQMELQNNLALEHQRHGYQQQNRNLYGASRSRMVNMYRQQSDMRWNLGQTIEQNRGMARITQDNINKWESDFARKYHMSSSAYRASGGTDEKALADVDKIAQAQSALQKYNDTANQAQQQMARFTGPAMAMRAGLSGVSDAASMLMRRLGRQLFQKALAEAKKFVQEFNQQMATIQMITMKSDEQMSTLGDGLIAKAKELKISISEISSSAATLYRQGLTDEEVDERLGVISKFSKVSGTKVEDATKLVTVAMNTGLVENAQEAADIVTALGDNAATNAQQIEKGIEKAGAAAAADGTTFAELASMLTAITSTTQIGGNVAGRTLNTIMGRMNKIGTNELITDENGNKISGSAVAKLLKAQGISMYDENGNKRSTYDTLYALSQKWEGMTDAEQQQIANAIAGTRQYSNFAAIMQGMAEGKVDEYMKLAGESSGITDDKFEIYSETLQATLTDLKNTFDATINDLVETGTLENIVGGLKDITVGAGELIKMLGGLPGLLIPLGAVAILMAGLRGGAVGAIAMGAVVAGVLGMAAFGSIKNSTPKEKTATENYKEYKENQQELSKLRTGDIERFKELGHKEKRTAEENIELTKLASSVGSYAGTTDSITKLVSSIDSLGSTASNATNDVGKLTDEIAKQAEEHVKEEQVYEFGQSLRSDLGSGVIVEGMQKDLDEFKESKIGLTEDFYSQFRDFQPYYKDQHVDFDFSPEGFMQQLGILNGKDYTVPGTNESIAFNSADIDDYYKYIKKTLIGISKKSLDKDLRNVIEFADGSYVGDDEASRRWGEILSTADANGNEEQKRNYELLQKALKVVFPTGYNMDMYKDYYNNLLQTSFESGLTSLFSQEGSPIPQEMLPYLTKFFTEDFFEGLDKDDTGRYIMPSSEDIMTYLAEKLGFVNGEQPTEKELLKNAANYSQAAGYIKGANDLLRDYDLPEVGETGYFFDNETGKFISSEEAIKKQSQYNKDLAKAKEELEKEQRYTTLSSGNFEFAKIRRKDYATEKEYEAAINNIKNNRWYFVDAEGNIHYTDENGNQLTSFEQARRANDIVNETVGDWTNRYYYDEGYVEDGELKFRKIEDIETLKGKETKGDIHARYQNMVEKPWRLYNPLNNGEITSYSEDEIVAARTEVQAEIDRQNRLSQAEARKTQAENTVASYRDVNGEWHTAQGTENILKLRNQYDKEQKEKNLFEVRHTLDDWVMDEFETAEAAQEYIDRELTNWSDAISGFSYGSGELGATEAIETKKNVPKQYKVNGQFQEPTLENYEKYNKILRAKEERDEGIAKGSREYPLQQYKMKNGEIIYGSLGDMSFRNKVENDSGLTNWNDILNAMQDIDIQEFDIEPISSDAAYKIEDLSTTLSNFSVVLADLPEVETIDDVTTWQEIPTALETFKTSFAKVFQSAVNILYGTSNALAETELPKAPDLVGHKDYFLSGATNSYIAYQQDKKNAYGLNADSMIREIQNARNFDISKFDYDERYKDIQQLLWYIDSEGISKWNNLYENGEFGMIMSQIKRDEAGNIISAPDNIMEQIEAFLYKNGKDYGEKYVTQAEKAERAREAFKGLTNKDNPWFVSLAAREDAFNAEYEKNINAPYNEKYQEQLKKELGPNGSMTQEGAMRLNEWLRNNKKMTESEYADSTKFYDLPYLNDLDDEYLTSILGADLTRKVKNKDKLSDAEKTYAYRLMNNAQYGITGLTTRDKIAGMNEIADAISRGKAIGEGEGMYDLTTAAQYLQGWGDFNEYAMLTQLQKTNIDKFEAKGGEARLKELQLSFENFKKNAEIKLEIEGIQQLEEAGEIVSGTASAIEKLRKGGKIELEAIVDIRSQYHKEGQLDAMLASNDKDKVAEAVMQITGATTTQYYASEEAQKYYQEEALRQRNEARGINAASLLELRKNATNKEQFDRYTALTSGYQWNGKDEYVLPTGFTIGTDGNIYNTRTGQVDTGETNRYRNRGRYEYVGGVRLDDEEIAKNMQTLSTGTTAEKLALTSTFGKEYRESRNAQYYLNNWTSESAGIIASYLGMDEKSVKDADKKEIQEAINDKTKEALVKQAEAYGADLTGLDVDSAELSDVKDKLLEEAERLGGTAGEYITNIANQLGDAASQLGEKDTESLGDIISKTQESLEQDRYSYQAMKFMRDNADVVDEYDGQGILQKYTNIDGWNEEWDKTVGENKEIVAASTLRDMGEITPERYNQFLDSQLLTSGKNMDYYDMLMSTVFGNQYSNGQLTTTVGLQDAINAARGNEFAPWVDELLQKYPDLEKAAEGFTSAQESLNEQFNKDRAAEVTKYSKGISNIGDIIQGLYGSEAQAKKAMIDLTAEMDNLADKKLALDKASGKSGKQLKSMADKGDKTLGILASMTSFSEDQLKEKTQAQIQNIVDGLTPTVNQTFTDTVQSLFDSIPPQALTIPIGNLITVNTDGSIDLSPVDSALEATAQNILAAIMTLARDYGGIDLQTLMTDTSVDIIGVYNAITSGLGLNLQTPSGYSGGKGGGGGGGKSEIDKLLEKQKQKIAELEHNSKMLEIQEKTLDFVNDYSGHTDNIDAQIAAQESLRAAYASNLSELKAQLASVEEGSDDYNKLADAIRSAEESMASITNTINELNSKKIQILQTQQENQDKPSNQKMALLDKYAARYQKSGQFEAYTKVMQARISEARNQINVNNVQIAEWESLLNEYYEGSDSWIEVRDKIWALQLENAELENQAASDLIDLEEARVAQIADDLAAAKMSYEHINNMMDTFGGMYQSTRQYEHYRETLSTSNENLTTMKDLTDKAIEEVKKQVESMATTDPARRTALQTLYELEETSAKYEAQILSNRQAIEESIINELKENHADASSILEHELKLLTEQEKEFTRNNDFVNYENILAEKSRNASERVAELTLALEDYTELQNSGQITEGSQQWRDLEETIRTTKEEIAAAKNEAQEFADALQASQFETLKRYYQEGIESLYEGMDQLTHEQNLIQYQETRYQSRGELTNYGTALTWENENLQEQRKALLRQIDAVKTLQETHKDNPQLYAQETEAIRKYEEELAKTENAIEKNVEAQKKNKDAILATQSAVLNTADKAIRENIQKQRTMLSATVNVESSILETIRKRFTEEWGQLLGPYQSNCWKPLKLMHYNVT